jgi:DNA repair protein RadC
MLPRKPKSWCVAKLRVTFESQQKIKIKIRNPEDAYKVFLNNWDLDLINVQESFNALFLNANQEVIAFRTINTGKIDRTCVDIPFLMSCALLCRATSMFIGHNHVLGDLNPSKEDKELTEQISLVCEIMDIKLLDSLIVSDKGYFSFADVGIL